VSPPKLVAEKLFPDKLNTGPPANPETMILPLVTTIGSARVRAGVNTTMRKSEQSPPKILDIIPSFDFDFNLVVPGHNEVDFTDSLSSGTTRC
jgi:hypothetical protein